VLAGRYEIVKTLGEGGMAKIVLAKSTSGQDVVLKVPLHQNVDHYNRLRDEARVGLRLNHPAIVETLDLFELDGKPILVVEFVDGASMAQIREVGPLSPVAVARIGRQIAEALDAIHNSTDEFDRPLNMLHRDVTPGNILVTRDGDAKLIDLGISRSAETQVRNTNAGAVRGTLRYLAPELIEGKKHNAACDLWSLGVVLWEAVLGRTAISGDDKSILKSILNGKIMSFKPGEAVAKPLQNAMGALLARSEERLQKARAAANVFGRLEEAFGDGQEAAAVAVERAIALYPRRLQKLGVGSKTGVLLQTSEPRSVTFPPSKVLAAPDNQQQPATPNQAPQSKEPSGAIKPPQSLHAPPTVMMPRAANLPARAAASSLDENSSVFASPHSYEGEQLSETKSENQEQQPPAQAQSNIWASVSQASAEFKEPVQTSDHNEAFQEKETAYAPNHPTEDLSSQVSEQETQDQGSSNQPDLRPLDPKEQTEDIPAPNVDGPPHNDVLSPPRETASDKYRSESPREESEPAAIQNQSPEAKSTDGAQSDSSGSKEALVQNPIMQQELPPDSATAFSTDLPPTRLMPQPNVTSPSALGAPIQDPGIMGRMAEKIEQKEADARASLEMAMDSAPKESEPDHFHDMEMDDALSDLKTKIEMAQFESEAPAEKASEDYKEQEGDPKMAPGTAPAPASQDFDDPTMVMESNQEFQPDSTLSSSGQFQQAAPFPANSQAGSSAFDAAFAQATDPPGRPSGVFAQLQDPTTDSKQSDPPSEEPASEALGTGDTSGQPTTLENPSEARDAPLGAQGEENTNRIAAGNQEQATPDDFTEAKTVLSPTQSSAAPERTSTSADPALSEQFNSNLQTKLETMNGLSLDDSQTAHPNSKQGSPQEQPVAAKQKAEPPDNDVSYSFGEQTSDRVASEFEEGVLAEREKVKPSLQPIVSSSPEASRPKAPEPKAPEPKAPEPKAPEPKAPEPKAPEPKAPEPNTSEPPAPEPNTSEPKAPEPKAPEPKAPEPKAPEPKAPKVEAPKSEPLDTSASNENRSTDTSEPDFKPGQDSPAEKEDATEPSRSATIVANEFFEEKISYDDESEDRRKIQEVRIDENVFRPKAKLWAGLVLLGLAAVVGLFVLASSAEKKAVKEEPEKKAVKEEPAVAKQPEQPAEAAPPVKKVKEPRKKKKKKKKRSKSRRGKKSKR
jgi:eukaryotic-like serine/threonine-protein kinase